MGASAIKAVIFDMGGVILRTEEGLHRARLAERCGVSRAELEHLVFASEHSLEAEVGRHTMQQHWDYVLAELGLTTDDQEAFLRDFWAGDRIDIALVDYIRMLRKQYQTALLSNAWDGTRRLVLSFYDFSDAFDTLIFSAEVGMRKPDPAIYQHMINLLQVQPDEAVFVDDVLVNIEAAQQAGLHGVQFFNTAQARRDLDALLNSA